jgi:hypothetical protein
VKSFLIGAGLLGLGGYAWSRLQGRLAEEREHALLARRRRDAHRRRDCDAVLREFASTRGYLAGRIASGADVRAWIDGGISAADLRSELDTRAGAIDGPLLGHIEGEGGEIPVRLPAALRARHLYAIGRTGTGKTTELVGLIRQDLEAGHGLAVVAPEAEMIHDELLPHIPRSRLDDVVLVDPADLRHPVSFNPLHLDEGEDLDLKSGELMAIFQRLADDTGTAAPRMEMILRQALYALLPVANTTLLDVERLLDRQDDGFRRWIFEQTSDEETRHFWRDVYPVYPKDAHLSLVNRLGRFLRPRTVRNLLCQPGPSFNVRRAMDERRVLLFKLSDGLLGEENAQLLGQLVVAKIQIAALSRANIPQHERDLFITYVDEFQRFANVAATSYEVMLSRARKYALGLVLAHQQMGQVGENLMREILGNVGTVVAFQVGATDARRLSRELVGEVDGQLVPVDAEQLVSLRTGEAICRIGRSVFRMRTLPPLQGGSAKVREEVVRRSRANYARPAHAAQRPARPDGLRGLNPGEAL